ncbi:hypothetical protein [Nonomuraea dietziae]|uniref:hypothetical protein n=1 Tax=Nonomuraea dietziae TaxID=65515 RepID=UPI0034461096
MDIKLMTYSLVAHDRAHRDAQLQEIEGKVMNFLLEHVEHIQNVSKHPDSAPPGKFFDPESREIFQALHAGSSDDFLASVGTLTKRLISRMTKATKPGLLVSLRAQNGAERLAAVLKLEILEPTGATLQQLGSGELRLSAVTDMLEKPGDLQKGVLVTSALPADEAICIDRLYRGARYFPSAMGIRMHPRPKEAASTFYEAMQNCAPQWVEPLVAALPKVRPGPPQQVITELAQHVSGMEAHLQAELIDRLERAPRPVTYLDTTRPVTRIIEAGEITVKGPAGVMYQTVKITKKPDGGWQILIDSPEEPEISHR